jgi:D-lactate dehydrogenase
VPARAIEAHRHFADGAELVFVPSCLSRIMGQPRDEELSNAEVFLLLAERSGTPVFVPSADELAGQCCGLALGSKGFQDEHALLFGRLVDRLWAWSDEGRLPIAIDATSCLQSLKTAGSLLDEAARTRLAALTLLDVLEVARDRFLPRLTLSRLERRVVLHPSCAARKLELDGALRVVAAECAAEVEVPINLSCCAMAGDRGLLYPELTLSAVAIEGAEIAGNPGEGYYSNNLTCEIGMTQATGRNYRSILYLLEEATRDT